MCPRRADRDLSAVMVSTQDEYGPEVEIGAGVFLPYSGFVADIHDPDLPYEVQLHVEVVNGEPVCRQFTIKPQVDGQAVTGTVLRSVPLASYVDRALEVQFPKYRKVEPADEDGLNAEVVGDAEFRQVRKRQPKSARLPEVIAEYKRALGDPEAAVRRAPTQAVADRLHLARGHVSRLLSEARKAGLLGAARPGRAGVVS